MTTRRRAHQSRAKRRQIRIIGGKWRGRKLLVAPRPTLRPSPDRVRETVFNWLAPFVSGARCLDLFAGTGVLGLEAVSRGAASAILIDSDPTVVEILRQNVAGLDANNIDIIEHDAFKWLRATVAAPFDIVFLDPPFGQGTIETVVRELDRGWLKNRAWVYLEAEKIPILQLETAGWRVFRQGHTRQVHFALAEINRVSDGVNR
jgi:16S rRNA (guanine966-N2)-methyltransferase